MGLEPLGAIPAGLPAPSADFINLGSFTALLPAVLAVAALAALESLLSATVADAMSVNEQHDPDRELFGQGLAKLAAFVHALVLLAIVLVAAPLVSEIPLATLSGVLLATTIRMVEVSSLPALAHSTRADAAVLALTFTITVVFDLVTAVGVGLGVAIILALRSVARSTRLEQVPVEAGDHTEVSDVRVIILRMSRISTIDATGAQVLGDAISRIERRGITVLLSGIADAHNEVLAALGVAQHLHLDGRVFADTPTAIRYARDLLMLIPDKTNARLTSHP